MSSGLLARNNNVSCLGGSAQGARRAENVSFDLALTQDMEGYHAERGSFMPGHMSLRRVVQVVHVDNFDADTQVLHKFVRMR